MPRYGRRPTLPSSELREICVVPLFLALVGCSGGAGSEPGNGSNSSGGNGTSSGGSVATSGGSTAVSGGSGGSAGSTVSSGGTGASTNSGGTTSAGSGGTENGGSGGIGTGAIGGFNPGGDPPELEPGVWTDVSPGQPDGWDVWGVRVNPANTAYVYAAMCGPGTGNPGGGVWRSTDAGATWGEWSVPGCATGVALDPNDLMHAYVSFALFAGDKGNFWVTTDGGENWTEKVLPYSSDVGRFVVDPEDFDHILLSFHYVEGEDHGIIESTDGGETWNASPSAPWGYGGTKSAHFLAGEGAWIIGTEGGYYRTTDGGENFDEVADGFVGTHGGGDTTYYSPDGSIYIPSYPAPMKSTDNGVTWTSTNNGLGNAGYYRILLGDGDTLYTAPDAGGEIGIATSPEGANLSWTWGTQMLPIGPSSASLDPVERILYVGQRQPGVYALKIPD
jgi:hypothetical protein